MSDLTTDIRQIEDAAATSGASLVADGTDVVDLSADTPDLTGVIGNTIYIDQADGTREHASILDANNTTKRVQCSKAIAAGSGLGWGIVNDTEMAGRLSAFSVSPIAPHIAKRYFREADLWQRNADGTFTGDLEASRVNGANPQIIRDGLNELWAVIYDDAAKSCGTTLYDYAKEVKDVVDFLVGVSQITQQHVDDFYALGGGLRYPSGVTTADIDAGRIAAKLQRLASNRREGVLADRRAYAKGKAEAYLNAYDNYYRTADYDQDIDHIATARSQALAAFTSYTP